jgi:hypothetical protein
MFTVFAVCAGVGGAILLVQLVLTLVGLGAETADIELEVDPDAGQSSFFFTMFSFKAIVAALAFFGIGGLIGIESGLSPFISMTIGVQAGILAMILVAWMMRLLYTMHEEGTVRVEHALGTTGRVYLTVPAHQSGAGKVTISIQGRTMEYAAVTDGDELATGATVVVTGLEAPGTLKVTSAAEAALDDAQQTGAPA